MTTLNYPGTLNLQCHPGILGQLQLGVNVPSDFKSD